MNYFDESAYLFGFRMTVTFDNAQDGVPDSVSVTGGSFDYSGTLLPDVQALGGNLAAVTSIEAAETCGVWCP